MPWASFATSSSPVRLRPILSPSPAPIPPSMPSPAVDHEQAKPPEKHPCPVSGFAGASRRLAGGPGGGGGHLPLPALLAGGRADLRPPRVQGSVGRAAPRGL